MEDQLTLAVASMHPHWSDKEHNCRQIIAYMEQAARAGVRLLVLPELCLTGYDDPVGTPFAEKVPVRLAETVPGPSSERIAEKAHELGLWVVFGMPERVPGPTDAPDRLFNAACIIGPDGIVGTYRKIHPFGRECEWAHAGTEPGLFATPWGPIGLGICYDLYSFPEMVMYAKAKGARLFVNPTAAAWTLSAASVFRAKIEVTCLRANLYVATANLQGTDRITPFVGRSHIIGPLGPRNSVHYFAGMPFDEEPEPAPGLHVATLDLGAVERQESWNLRVFETNPLTGRPDWRPDLYARWFADIANDPAWQARTTGSTGTLDGETHTCPER